MNPVVCPKDPSIFLLYQADAPNLLYYSHVPGVIILIMLGSILLYLSPYKLTSRIFFSISLLFGLWSFLDILLWTLNDSGWILFLWSVINVIDPIIFFLCVVFVYAYTQTPFLWRHRIFGTLLIAPFVLLMATPWMLEGVGIDSDCEAVEGILSSTILYVVDGIFMAWLIFVYVRSVAQGRRARINGSLLITVGLLLFLGSFMWSNVIGSVTHDWRVSQWGLFGAPIFGGMLVYAIVKYQAFNTRLIGAQILVTALLVLIATEVFFIESSINIIFVAGTFVITAVFGYLLTQSVKKEINRKEELESLAKKLEEANIELKRLDTSKSEFISIASHQLRTPLTAIKGYMSLINEGSYASDPDGLDMAHDRINTSNERMIRLVEDLLNTSRIESGRMHYIFAELNICEVLRELQANFLASNDRKDIEFTFTIPEKRILIHGDRGKITEVLSNIIDNALKYTEKGFVRVEVVQQNQSIRIIVSDSGIGIPEHVLPQLFQKFSRGNDLSRLQVTGTGLGLYVAKNITKEHGGTITVDSEGAGKGSVFTVTLPVAKEGEPTKDFQK